MDSWSGQIKKFVVVDNEREAIQLYKKVVAGFLYETVNLEEVSENQIAKAEKLLEKYGFLEDMKSAYSVLEASGGNMRSQNIENFLKEKYPNYDSELIMIALSALQAKGCVKWDVENNVPFFIIVKRLEDAVIEPLEHQNGSFELKQQEKTLPADSEIDKRAQGLPRIHGHKKKPKHLNIEAKCVKCEQRYSLNEYIENKFCGKCGTFLVLERTQID